MKEEFWKTNTAHLIYYTNIVEGDKHEKQTDPLKENWRYLSLFNSVRVNAFKPLAFLWRNVRLWNVLQSGGFMVSDSAYKLALLDALFDEPIP